MNWQLIETAPIDDWINWDGGSQPVASTTIVEVKLRDNGLGITTNPASFFDWVHDDMDNDIVAYREVK